MALRRLEDCERRWHEEEGRDRMEKVFLTIECYWVTKEFDGVSKVTGNGIWPALRKGQWNSCGLRLWQAEGPSEMMICSIDLCYLLDSCYCLYIYYTIGTQVPTVNIIVHHHSSLSTWTGNHLFMNRQFLSLLVYRIFQLYKFQRTAPPFYLVDLM